MQDFALGGTDSCRLCSLQRNRKSLSTFHDKNILLRFLLFT